MKALEGFVDYFNGAALCGWARDPDDPERALDVDIFLDDLLVATVAADQYREDLAAVSPSNLSKAFTHTFDPALCPPGSPINVSILPRITVKIARTDILLLPVPGLLGVVNEDAINVAETLCVHADNRFLPTPPQKMIDHVAGDGTTPSAYRSVGMFIVLDLLDFGLLSLRSGTIADIGCGSGRIATQLAPLHGDQWEYHGFDTWAAGVRWATENISSVYPTFHFTRLGASASDGDPGYVGTSAYTLPIDDGSCDLVLATSVLTHLTYDAAAQYLSEFRRVLKDDGRAYVTFFIYDDESKEAIAGKKLRTDEHGAYYQHRDFFDTFFTGSAVDSLLSGAGFTPVLKRFGAWRGEQYAKRKRFGFQDLLVLKPTAQRSG